MGCDLRFLLEWSGECWQQACLGLCGALLATRWLCVCLWPWRSPRAHALGSGAALTVLAAASEHRAPKIFKARLEQQKMHCHRHSCP